jgi:hypothetical protein
MTKSPCSVTPALARTPPRPPSESQPGAILVAYVGGHSVEDAIEHREAFLRRQRFDRAGVRLRVVEEVAREVLGALLLPPGPGPLERRDKRPRPLYRRRTAHRRGAGRARFAGRRHRPDAGPLPPPTGGPSRHRAAVARKAGSAQHADVVANNLPGRPVGERVQHLGPGWWNWHARRRKIPELAQGRRYPVGVARGHRLGRPRTGRQRLFAMLVVIRHVSPRPECGV